MLGLSVFTLTISLTDKKIWRQAFQYNPNNVYRVSVLHTHAQLTPRSVIQTWIGEDPCGDVCPRAHYVLYIQTGLHTSLSCSLSSHNSVHLRVMLEAPAKHAHELSQVCGAVVLLQELKEKMVSLSTELMCTCLTATTFYFGIYSETVTPELQPGCCSELFPHQLLTGYSGPSRWQESLPGERLAFASCWRRLCWAPAAL